MTKHKKVLILVLSVVTAVCAVIAPLTGIAGESSPLYNGNVTVKYVKEEQKTPDILPEIGCAAAFIAEPVTGKIFFEKNAHEKRYPASTTKILTALLVMENCQMTDQATVSQNAIDLVPDDYITAGLRAGERLSVKDLLYALLLPSANDAAVALAEQVSGSVEEFAKKCNQRAKELGCENLHFVNPNGIHSDEHYCTAYDLYLIAKECRKHDIFNDIVATKSYDLPSTEQYPGVRTLENSNDMLYPGAYYYENCTGIKTGFTDEAGQCFVGSCSKDGFGLISVVMGGGINENGQNERFFDTKRLFEYVYDNYSTETLTERGDVLATVKVGKATAETENLKITADQSVITVLPKGTDKSGITATLRLDGNVVAPIVAGQVLGSVTYSADGLEYTVAAVAAEKVEKLPYTLYNILVAAAVALTLTVFFIVLKKSKKHKKEFFISYIIVIAAEIICLVMLMKAGSIDSVTKVTSTAPAVTLEQTDGPQTGG